MSKPFNYLNKAWTKIKLQTFVALLRALCENAKTVIDEGRQDPWREPCYFYIDGNAGPGSYMIDDQIEYGSPVVFLQMAETLRLPYRAFLCEMDLEYCRMLADNLGLPFGYVSVYMSSRFENLNIVACDRNNLINHRKIKSTTIFNNKNSDMISSLINFSQEYHIKKVLGLIYLDPNGADIPFKQLAELSNIEAFEKTDILIYISARNLKRAHQRGEDFMYLSDSLDTIKKSNWHIRLPMGQHQWAFLLGTNWNRFPDIEPIGFYRLDSDIGKYLFNNINFTKNEISSGKYLEIVNNSNFLKKFCGV